MLLPLIYYNDDLHVWQKTLYLICRSVFILILWYTLLGPWFMKLLNKILLKKRDSYRNDLQGILKIQPSLNLLFVILGMSVNPVKVSTDCHTFWPKA